MLILQYNDGKIQKHTNDKYYFITITPHSLKKVNSYAKIHMVFNTLCYNFPFMTIVNKSYELGSKYGRLHLHLLVRSPQTLSYYKQTSINNFQIFYKKLYNQNDVHRVQLYISKDKYATYSF